MPEQLKPVEIPYHLVYLWEWFCQLSGSRGFSEVGPLPLSYQEIKAWAELTRMEPMAWEVQVIKNIDTLYLTESMKK